MAQPARIERWGPPAALGIALTGATASVVAVGLLFLGLRRGFDLSAFTIGDAAVGLAFPLVGATIIARRPQNAAGWVLVSAAAVGVSALAHVWVEYNTEGGALPGLQPAIWIATWAFTPYFLQPTLLPLLFPSGRSPGGKLGVVVRVQVGLVALAALAGATRTDPDVEGLGVANPVALVPEPWDVVNLVTLAGTALWSFFVLSPVALIWFFVQLRRSRGTERAQRAWLLLGFCAAAASVLISTLTESRTIAHALVWSVGFGAIPVTILIAVVRHQLLDVELVVNRTFAWSLLTGAGLLAYFAAVAVVDRLAGDNPMAPVIAAAVALGAVALRQRAQRVIERWLFGSARDPYDVIERVGVEIESAPNAPAALTRLGGALREALRVPYVAVEPAAPGAAAVASGRPVDAVERLPMILGGRRLGTLVVGKRRGADTWRAREMDVLRDVARRAASVLEASALAEDLRRSRDDLVIAREEERRRVRRDLHDGIGPTLASLALQVDGLAARLDSESDLLERTTTMRARVTEAVGEVRRIIDGLRPASVDELGLAEALRQLATTGGPGPQVTVEAPAALPELPAAVEVAAYRIASEAVANAQRHANAGSCRVAVRYEADRLTVEVTDDGRGFGEDAAVGIGLESIHARALEVGGAAEVHSTPGGGTRVSAWLPVHLP